MQPEHLDRKATDRNFLNLYIFPSCSRGAIKTNTIVVLLHYDFNILFINFETCLSWSPNCYNMMIALKQAEMEMSNKKHELTN